MKIAAIEVMRLEMPPSERVCTPPRRASWAEDAEVANPMSCFPRYKRHRSLWLPAGWRGVWVKVTAEDGTWGLGSTDHGRVTAAIIEDHLAPLLVGEPVWAIERLWDLMFRASKPYGSQGLAACAMSAVDLALWDLAGKLRGAPVYELLGGPSRDELVCYATGNDTDWQLELGFQAVKLACPYGPADGQWGLERNEAFVARARETAGVSVEIMLDCYMAFDVEYTVRLAERLRPYRLRWVEEYLIPEDMAGHREVRRRLPWQTLATGEHWTTPWPFAEALREGVVDILQPDLRWVGGITPAVHIARIAQAAGKSVILHAGGMDPFGQHFSLAVPNVPWVEYGVWSAPGVPLNEAVGVPGSACPVDGRLRPNSGPGFGLEIEEGWLRPFFG